MNKSIFSILFAALLLSAGSVFGQSCTGYHKKACKSGADQGWVYNSQSKSGLFEYGMSSEIKIVIYKDNDYSLSMCNEKSLGKGELMITIKDAKTGEVIYDNATDDRAQHIEFTCATTRNVIVTVTAGGEAPSGGAKGNDNKKTAEKNTTAKNKSSQEVDGGCVGLLIEQKASSKEGF